MQSTTSGIPSRTPRAARQPHAYSACVHGRPDFCPDVWEEPLSYAPELGATAMIDAPQPPFVPDDWEDLATTTPDDALGGSYIDVGAEGFGKRRDAATSLDDVTAGALLEQLRGCNPITVDISPPATWPRSNLDILSGMLRVLGPRAIIGIDGRNPQPEDLAALHIIRTETLASYLRRNPNPQYQPVVIEGVLRAGETMNLIGGTKVGKSWIAGQLALCLAAGIPWLGRRVEPGPVLLVDGELGLETLTTRLTNIAEVLGLDLATAANNLTLLSLRERDDIDLTMLDRDLLSGIKPGDYRAILLDPLYCLLGPHQSEIRDEDMRQVYRVIRRIATRSGTSVIVTHHNPKGTTDGKRVTDMGSGSGVLSRSVDTHLALIAVDEQADDAACATLRGATRTFAPFVPQRLRRISTELPVWMPDDGSGGAAAESLRIANLRAVAEDFVRRFASDKASKRRVIIANAQNQQDKDGKAISGRRAGDLFDISVEQGLLTKVKGGYARPVSRDVIAAQGDKSRPS